MKTKLLIGLIALFGFSQAWAVPCSDTATGIFTLGTTNGTTGGIPGNSVSVACEDGGANNDPYPNDLSFGGMDWDALDKAPNNDADDPSLVDLSYSGTTYGELSFTNIAGYHAYIVVLKGGGVLSGDKYSAYEVANSLLGVVGSTVSMDWVYGYGKNNLKDISHISIYGWKDNGDVSAPAILGIMGIGLMGMLLSSGLRRRKIS